MKTTLLVDGDILAYRYAAVGETNVDWGDGTVSHDAGDLDEAYAQLQAHVETLRERANADKAVICVTPSNTVNWRMAIWPTYKAHRKDTRKPVHVEPLRDRIIADGGYARPGLEADDIIGILATDKGIIRGRKIIWSVDKDLLQIPGLHLGERAVLVISEAEADRWHMMQTLTGDAVDGYPGLPACGPVGATEALDAMTVLVPRFKVMERGPRKGQEVPWGFEEVPAKSAWEVVVSRYAARGYTEADALVQARVSRILRASDYDFEKKEPILWTPPST